MNLLKTEDTILELVHRVSGENFILTYNNNTYRAIADPILLRMPTAAEELCSSMPR